MLPFLARGRNGFLYGSAFAMPVVLISLAVISICIYVLISIINMHNKLVVDKLQRRKLEYIASGGLFKVLWLIRSSKINLPMKEEEYIIIPETCRVIIRRRGVFWEIYSRATLGNRSVEMKRLLGFPSFDLFPNALQVCGEIPVFVFSSNVYIDGNICLDAVDVHYYPLRIERIKFYTGKLVCDTTVKLPAVNKSLLDSIYRLYDENIDYLSPEFVVLESKVFSPSELKKFKYIYLDGDVEIRSVYNDTLLEGPGKIVVNGMLTFANKVKVRNNWEITSSGDIFVKDSSELTSCIVFSKAGIYFSGNSRGLGQFISEKQITSTDNSKLIFPTFFLVQSNDKKSFSEPEISIQSNSDYSGILFVYKPEDRSFHKNQLSGYGRIYVNSAQSVKGGIFCEGIVELYSNVVGFVSCKRIDKRVGYTLWKNYVQNVQICRYDLNPRIALPVCFGDFTKLALFRE
ncbi:MAG: hypothetical protein H0Z29_07860 [Candidatus Marinimicrobia bacterium]|nr:hypothetical protein [Candidatus Neomarinimicrobiota bacterium]